MLVQRAPSLSRIAALIDRYQAPLACVIAVHLLLALHDYYGFTGPHFDSAQYWGLASVENFGKALSSRGYVFPALLFPLRYFSDMSSSPLLAYRVEMSVVYGVLLTTLLPAAFRQAFGGTLTLARRLVPVVLLAILFPGLLLYPLSDLPAVLLAFAALMCALRGLDASASRKNFIYLLMSAGMLMGAAYNTRTIYLFAGIPLGLMALVAYRGSRPGALYPRWLGLAALAVGVLVVSLPQLAINKRTLGVNSMAVQSLVSDKSLFATQLVWGMTLQRYETTVTMQAPAPQVYYFDPAGAMLFTQTLDGGDHFSVLHYIKSVAKHPLQFFALYARHVVNGLDVRDGLVYTLKPSPLRNRTALFNFLVLALAVWVVASLRTRLDRAGQDSFLPIPAWWQGSLTVLVLPVVAIIPGAVETRFFLPVHLLAYCAIAMHFDAQLLRQHFKLHRRAVLLTLLIGAAAFFAVTYSTMANLQYDWPDIYRKGPQK